MSKTWLLLRKRSSALLLAVAVPLVAAAEMTVGVEKSVATPELVANARATHVDTASDGPTIMVVWSDRRTDVGSDIFGALLDRSGRILVPNIALTSTADIAETDPLVEFDGTRYLVVWFDGTNTVAAELGTDGAILTPPTVIAPGRPTALIRGTRDNVVAMTDETGTTIGAIKPGLIYTEGPKIRASQQVRVVRVENGYLAFWVELISGRAALRGVRIDSRGRVADTLSLGVLGSFNTDLSVAVTLENNIAVVAAAARDRMVVARVTQTGVVTPLTTIDATTTRSVEEIIPRTGGFDIVAIISSAPRILRYTADAPAVDTQPLNGPAASGAATLTAGRLFTVWAIDGTVTGRFAFSNTEPLVLISQSAPNQQLPALATDGSAVLAVWSEDVTETRDRIVASLIGRDGTPLTNPVTISLRTMSPMTSVPAVTQQGNHYFVAWVDAKNGVDKPAQLTMRTIERGGEVAGDIPVSKTVNPIDSPALASGAGDALVVWAKSGSSPNVRAAFVSDPSRHYEIEQLLRQPAVAFGNGAYTIVGLTTGGSIRGLRFLPDGVVGETLFDTGSTTDAKPAIAFGGGDFLVVFRRGTSIFGRFTGTGLEFPIAASGDQPRVAWDGQAFVVAWSEFGDVSAVRVGPNGFPEDLTAVSATTLNEDFPAVVGLGDGTALAAYQRMVPELYNIHRIFTRVLTPKPPPEPKKPGKRRSVR